MRRFTNVALVCASLSGCAVTACRDAAPPADDRPALSTSLESADPAARAITADVLRDAVTRLASDEFEGRGPATEGDRRTRAYLIEKLQSMGFEPGGPGGAWEQPFDIVGITASAPRTWRFTTPKGAVDLRIHDDVMAVSGVQAPAATLEKAEVVFVGYGIEAPEYGWDDFKGADLKGKVLLMLNNDPDWDPALFEGERRLYYGRWTYKYESAARQGAAGAIIIHTTPSAGYPWQVVQTSWSGEQFELPAQGQARVQVQAWIRDDAARRLLSAVGQDLETLVTSARSRDFRPVPLGIRTSLAIRNRLTKSQTANVAGLLRGSDPALRDQVVVYSAHHDHLGIGEADASGDRIYNGARDNAAGVAQVLAIGRAFAALPARPRRSILLLFVAAEEQGLLGSAWFARNPVVPAGRLAANINYDGGNIWGRTRDVTLIGLGKSSLDAVATQVAARQGRELRGDQFPDRGSYYRSDQFSFAQIGVPALYYDEGTEFIGRPEGWGRDQAERWEAEQYHQPSDEIDGSWNFEGMIEDAQLGFYSGVLIANDPPMPTWVPGDEFEAARKAALDAVQ